MNLRLTPRAESELIEIASYLVVRNPGAARRVEDALQDAFALIADYPYSGRELRDGLRRFALRRYPYLVFYGIHETAQLIEVYAVRHAAREDEEG